MPKKFEKILKNPKKRSRILRYLRKGKINQAINYSEGAMGYKRRTSKKRRARIRRKLKKLKKKSKRKSGSPTSIAQNEINKIKDMF